MIEVIKFNAEDVITASGFKPHFPHKDEPKECGATSTHNFPYEHTATCHIVGAHTTHVYECGLDICE